MRVKSKISEIEEIEKIKQITNVVAEEFGVTYDAMRSGIKIDLINVPRRTAQYIAVYHYGLNIQRTMEFFNKDRSLYYDVVKKINNFLDTDKDFAVTYERCLLICERRIDGKFFNGKIVIDTNKRVVDFFSADGDKYTYTDKKDGSDSHELNVIAKTILNII